VDGFMLFPQNKHILQFSGNGPWYWALYASPWSSLDKESGQPSEKIVRLKMSGFVSVDSPVFRDSQRGVNRSALVAAT
jgi:hypothetical protein